MNNAEKAWKHHSENLGSPYASKQSFIDGYNYRTAHVKGLIEGMRDDCIRAAIEGAHSERDQPIEILLRALFADLLNQLENSDG